MEDSSRRTQICRFPSMFATNASLRPSGESSTGLLAAPVEVAKFAPVGGEMSNRTDGADAGTGERANRKRIPAIRTNDNSIRKRPPRLRNAPGMGTRADAMGDG